MSWLTCLFGPHFSRLRCPLDSYLPPLFLARVSHFYSYVLSLQRDLKYNMGGAINTLTQTGTTCALVLLVNVTRPSLQTARDN